MEKPSDTAIEHDLEVNRRLCLHLLHRMAQALRQAELQVRTPEETEVTLPAWATLLFGNKEGLMGAYIKLSQQHLKIAQMQMELRQQRSKEVQETSPAEETIPSLSDEEIGWVKAWLQRHTETSTDNIY